MIEAGERIQHLAASAADPPRSSQYLREFEHCHPALFQQLVREDERALWLVTLFSFSHFLAEEVLRRPDWLFGISDMHRPLTAVDYRQHLAEFLKTPGTAATAFDLALFRRKEMLRVVIRDALQIAAVAEVTEELSNLADAILDTALASVVEDVQARYGLPLTNDLGPSKPAVFTVIALGKLGGRELNYSSDIDLMFLYSGNGETSGPQKITNKEFFKKVANQYTTLLSTYTSAGLCYRVDLRLRPEGSLGDVCMPLAAVKEYYAKRARDWELQMQIKARVAAGDKTIGQELLDFVEPSIYSTTLDFSTIESMSATRERISEKLARKRMPKTELNVKLARGGIRDIEFLVQCLQRLHGGREIWVRHGGTLLALSRLFDKDLLSATEYSRLGDAYRFLRHLEHRLQFEDDRQTHSLPADPSDLDRIAQRMPAFRVEPGARPSTQLLRELNQHLENVQGIYERIVHAQRPLYYAPTIAAVPASSNLPAPAPQAAIPELSEHALNTLKRAAPALAEQLRRRGIRRSEGLLLSLLEKLASNPEQLSALENHPLLADYAIQIFELSPFLSQEIMQRPELLEELRRVVDHPAKLWAFESLAAPLNDVDALRRFFRREMFRIQSGSVCLQESVFQTLDRTSALAEFVIARAYRIALERGLAHARAHATEAKPFHHPQNEMMVVALGRLGMREFDAGSDADLLFIIPDSEAPRQRFWTRAAEHLIEILTAYTGEGSVLSLDTRLRPNGREGMLVQTESKYVDYFANKAEAWEGIAYMKARAVAGDTERATEFLSELQRVDWRRYGQSGRSRQDLHQMRMRLQREQGHLTPLKAGEGGYYDADFILMYLRLKGAGMFFKSLNTPERIEVVERMGHLERADAEFLLQATTYYRALDHALRLVTGRAEAKLPASGIEREMIAELMHRWTNERPSAATLETELAALQAKMRRLFESIFGH
jgi:glutamate-ammonia-ligase adenylyltransferase